MLTERCICSLSFRLLPFSFCFAMYSLLLEIHTTVGKRKPSYITSDQADARYSVCFMHNNFVPDHTSVLRMRFYT